ncbi:golgin candidate 1 isoform X2 [Brassica rapa]|uniref:golgin candidate 1 isoform X2 n=1 Tax=Brassica campestris TaxID=3711 RepID=UPI00142DC74C|nr:golgin candidate 1 isoform X2 [Brassica rapa]
MDALKNQAALNEGKLSSLQVECTSLDQELQDMEVRARRGQTKSPDEPNQVTHGEVDSARQAQRDAEKKLASMEAGMLNK